MPYTITWRDRGTYTKLVGKVTIDEVAEANNEHYYHSRFKDITYQLFDFTEADCSDVTLADTKYPAAFDTAANFYKKKFKVAMVVADEHTKILCLTYIKHANRYATSWEMEVFDSVAAANTWCGEVE